VTVITLFAVIAAGLWFYANLQRKEAVHSQRKSGTSLKNEADRRAMLSLAQTLNVQALNQRVSNPPLALLLARQAYFIHQQYQGAMFNQIAQTIRTGIGAVYWTGSDVSASYGGIRSGVQCRWKIADSRRARTVMYGCGIGPSDRRSRRFCPSSMLRKPNKWNSVLTADISSTLTGMARRRACGIGSSRAFPPPSTLSKIHRRRFSVR